MNAMLEKMAGRIVEAYQTDTAALSHQMLNAFHRPVTVYNSSDLSFISAHIASGLRGSAFLYARDLAGNAAQLAAAIRNHLPLVVHVHPDPSGYSVINYYDALQNVFSQDCFQFIASSLQDHIYLQSIAHRIAELALLPVIIIADYRIDENQDISLPDEFFVLKYLGNVDDPVDTPTPGQEMIFGKKRRRVPNWFSFDTPVGMGVQKDGEALNFESAAHQKYIRNHLPELVNQAIAEFHNLTDVVLHPVYEIARKKSEYCVISIGTGLEQYFVDLGNKFPRVDFISIHQVNPFPASFIKDRISGKKGVTILHPVITGTHANVLLSSILALVSEAKTITYSGAFGGELNQAMLELAIGNMWSRKAKRNFFLGIPWTKEHSSFPKHQVLLEEIENQYPGISEDSIYLPNITSEAFVKNKETPAILRRYQNRGPNYSRLSRFYDDTAFFYQQNLRSELVADPFSTLSIMPSATAGFADQSSSRASVPSFLAERCTGCGACFVQCPHAALPPIAIGIQELLKAASGILTSKNKPVTRITPMIKNMAKMTAKIIDGQSVNKVADFLPQAFQQVAGQMKLEGDKLEVATNEFMAIMNELGDFPISITETFFHQPETLDQGTGELFSLVIDPAACTGCGVCVAACPEDALELVPEEDSNLTGIKRHFKTWEFLPDTSGDTIRRLQHNSAYSSLAAAMLSRNYYMTMTGGDAGKMQSDSKKIVHIITTLTEAVVQPKILDQIKKIDSFIDALTDNVHKKLSDALPTENLENLSDSLKDVGRRKIHLQDIMQHSDGAMLGKFIDSGDLQRKTDLIKDLKDLKWILEEGPTGVGRARFGIILAGKSLDWASKYPNNHFMQPLFIHRNGSTASEAMALFLGQLRHQLDYIKLLRRAELEAKDKYDPATHDLGIAELSWSELVEEEKQFIAPILLMVDQQHLHENGWGELHKLLSENYPIKVILLDDLCIPTDFPIASLAQINSGIISTISLKNAYVFQGSLGNTDHLFEGLMEGLHSMSPALMHIYIANYAQHEGAELNSMAYSQLAIDTRALPLIKYNPKTTRDFLRGAIDLSENKEVTKNWVVEKLALPAGDTMEYPQSWADWAFTQQGWKGHFELLPETTTWKLVPTFLSLDEKSRENTVPVIARVGAEGFKFYSVSSEVVRITRAVLDHWRTLQELSGMLYEFPQRLEEEVIKRLTGEFEIKINETEERYSVKLKEQEDAQMQKVKEQLKQRLLTLVLMARNKVQN